MFKEIILRIIKIYQRILSPDHGIFKRQQRGCRFYPTCSDYAYQAVEKFGVTKGLFLGIKRILRCHPWNKGGYDPL
jgi:hypothetical protein